MKAVMVILLAIGVAFIGKSVVPPYLEFYAVKDIFVSLSSDPDVAKMSKGKIKDLFERKLQVNNIHDVKAENLNIEKQNEKTILHLQYEVRTHVIANMDVVMTFKREAMVQ